MNTKLLIGLIAALALAVFFITRQTERDDTSAAPGQPPAATVGFRSAPGAENPAGQGGADLTADEQGGAEITVSQELDSDEVAEVTRIVRDVRDRTERGFLVSNEEAERIVGNLHALGRDVRRHRVVELDREAVWSLLAIARGEIPQLPIRYIDLAMFADTPCTLNASALRRVREVRPGHWSIRTGCIQSGGLYGIEALYQIPEGWVQFTQEFPDGRRFTLVPLEGIYSLAYETGPQPTRLEGDVLVR